MIKENNIYNNVKELLYDLTGITLTEDKDIMITNRLEKLKRNTNFSGEIEILLSKISKGEYINEFVNTFTTNKTNFFREEFHFIDLKNRVLKNNQNLDIYCCASSTGEEPYSIAMTIKEINKQSTSKIIATDIDTNVLEYASRGIYRYQKSSREFPTWIKPNLYFKKRKKINSADEVLIKVNNELKEMITFAKMNLNDDNYPFKIHQFDVIFCRNVLIYFSMQDQEKILKKLFKHLKIGGTLYLGHSESPQDLINYVKKIGQNIFVKEKEIL